MSIGSTGVPTFTVCLLVRLQDDSAKVIIHDTLIYTPTMMLTLAQFPLVV